MAHAPFLGASPARVALWLALVGAAYGFGAALGASTVRTRAAERPEGDEVAPTPAVIWEDLCEGNRRFTRGALAPRPVLAARARLASGQQPRVAVLGCADSRVPPEIVFDKSLGDLFVVRTAGNVADAVALGSLEYAVDHLHASVLVVLGHEKCGAVAAAESGAKMPSPGLEAIVARIAPALAKPGAAPAPKPNANIEANVRRSAESLLKESPILDKAAKKGELTVIRALYQLESGEVVKL